MKKYLTLFIIAVLVTSCGVTKNLQAPTSIERIVELNESKDKLYIKANEWMVSSFKSAKSVIQFSDKEEGIITGKYLMKEGQAGSQYVAKVDDNYALITIRVKDNASKIEVSPIGLFYTNKPLGVELGFTPEMFNESANTLIDSFTTSIKQESSVW